MSFYHHTLKETIEFEGIGLHLGQPSHLKLIPSGRPLHFIHKGSFIPVSVSEVAHTRLSTALKTDAGSISTVEHLLSALNAMGISALRIEIEGDECPILDGSALPFVERIVAVGKTDTGQTYQPYKSGLPIESIGSDYHIKYEPSDHLQIDYTVDYPNYGRELFRYHHTPEHYMREIAPARTFTFESVLASLEAQGLIKGGNLDNALVLKGKGEALNGLRFEDEPVRHKILDFMGDLALLGRPCLGHFSLYKAGHGSHVKMIKKLIEKEKGISGP